jgi:hypothetical protein
MLKGIKIISILLKMCGLIITTVGLYFEIKYQTFTDLNTLLNPLLLKGLFLTTLGTLIENGIKYYIELTPDANNSRDNRCQ